jgi:hypothetical protein
MLADALDGDHAISLAAFILNDKKRPLALQTGLPDVNSASDRE